MTTFCRHMLVSAAERDAVNSYLDGLGGWGPGNISRACSAITDPMHTTTHYAGSAAALSELQVEQLNEAQTLYPSLELQDDSVTFWAWLVSKDLEIYVDPNES